MSSLQLVEYHKKSYKVGLDLEEASQRRDEDLVEVRHSKREKILLNKRGGGEELLLQSKQLFSEASQTHHNDTLEMAVVKAGFEGIFDLSEVGPQLTEYKDEVAAALAISKAISEGSDEKIRLFMERGCVGKLCEFLKSPDPKIVVCCLEVLGNILKVGLADKRAGKNSGKNIYREMIADCGGLDLMERLLEHDNPEVTDWFEAFKKVMVIITIYYTDWPNDDDDYPAVNEIVYQVIDVPSEFDFMNFRYLDESSAPGVKVHPWRSFAIA